MKRTMRSAVTSTLLVGSVGLTGCSLDGLLKGDQLPSSVTDPAITQTTAGAMAAYRGTVVRFRQAFGSGEAGGAIGATYAEGGFVVVSGLLADELRQGNVLGYLSDQRNVPEGNGGGNGDGSNLFSVLQKTRAEAGQAIGLLTRFAADSGPLVGHVYALEGYTEVFLAELYCSGIPLSTVDFDGNYTLRPGSTTDQVLTHAIALFDTAQTLTGDSVRFQYLAAVGKARALLGLGEYAAAAAAVAGVPDVYSYQVSYTATSLGRNFVANRTFAGRWNYSVADQEGFNGLNYVTAADPRAPTTAEGANALGTTVYRPTQYATNGGTPIVLASGVEARLIEAEAALQAGDVTGWLDKLNHLRETAISPALADTVDPGTLNARVDLLFRERAFWLFVTGHRQGDLRRLVRQYGRPQNQVYPVGTYPATLPAIYGNDVNLPIPTSELNLNPLFTGCASRDA